MKTSAVLAAVKPFVGHSMHSGNRYICHAVSEAYAYNKFSKRDRTRIHYIINERLGSSSSLEDWLDIHHGIVELEYPNGSWAAFTEYENYRAKMQATRHAWIDSMIAEFQKKGD